MEDHFQNRQETDLVDFEAKVSWKTDDGITFENLKCGSNNNSAK